MCFFKILSIYSKSYMSKKVVRLTESQLRLMINKVIKEQTAPAAKPTSNPVAPQQGQQTDPNVKQSAIEALTKMNVPAYISKYNPGYIMYCDTTSTKNPEYLSVIQKWQIVITAIPIITGKSVGGHVIYNYQISAVGASGSIEDFTPQQLLEGINNGSLSVSVEKRFLQMNPMTSMESLFIFLHNKLTVLQMKQLLDIAVPGSSQGLIDALQKAIGGVNRNISKGDYPPGKLENDLKLLKGQ